MALAMTIGATLPACRRASDDDSRPMIVGGTPSAPGAWPAVAALGLLEGSDGASRLLCTATFIDSRHLLTAAHCLTSLPRVSDPTTADGVSYDATTLRVTTGAGVEGGTFESGLPVLTAVRHPLYNRHPLGRADLALLTLAASADSDAPWPVMPDWDTAADLQAAGSVRLVGYGRRDDGGMGRKFEVETRVTARTINEAKAGGLGRDACDGDSGGPVFAQGAGSGAPFLLATVSRGFGFDCGKGGYVALTEDAACWLARQRAAAGGQPGVPSACRAARPLPDRALATLTFAGLCRAKAATTTQRETMRRVIRRLGVPDCESAALALAEVTKLDLSHLGLRDLSPLANLPRLSELDLTGNRLTDAGPLLHLPGLRTVRIAGNRLTSAAALSALGTLADRTGEQKVLILGRGRQLDNHADTAFLRACQDPAASEPARRTIKAVFWSMMTDDCALANERLLASATLRLRERNLTDLAPLAGLPLQSLDVAGNPLTDLGPVATLEELRSLDLTGTPVTDTGVLAPLTARGLVITGP